MKFSTLSATLLGLITVGLYWIVFFKKWLNRNQEYKESYYKLLLAEDEQNKFVARLRSRTSKNLKLAHYTLIGLGIGIVLFIIESIAELGFNSYPLPEELFWFYVWLVFSLFAILLASIALQLRNTQKEEEAFIVKDGGHPNADQEKPWLLQGEGKRIYILVILNVICALGLLPFVIFPPILGTAMNGYVKMEEKALARIS